MNPTQTALRTKLEKLECHFTWGLEVSRYKLLSIRDHLEDIGSDESYPWLGQKYNLWAYVHHTLGSTSMALQCLSNKAEVAFHQNNPLDTMGPWLLVHYGNLAWVHYHLDNQAESQAYVTKVAALLRDYPSPSQGELHPEVCAEKAWTLMKCGQDKRQKAIEYFQMAIRMEPGRKEWQSSHVLALDSVIFSKRQESEFLEKLRLAKEHDPDNLYVASVYLLRLGRSGQVRREEAQCLAKQILKKPASCYNGIKPLLRFYRQYFSHDDAIDLAHKALERHPNVRYLKKRLAKSYKWKINSGGRWPKGDSLSQSLINKAISVYMEVVLLYPETSIKVKLELASIYAKSRIDKRELANQIYEELLASVQDPSKLQLLYNQYATYLYSDIKDYNGSIDYHKKAAEIPNSNKYGRKSIKILRKIREEGGKF
ncbi:interferon-induced protein with tetratricopeptide repeats 2-like isoform X1 [Salvelinus namaycush]|uniref:Interferon-induced protein with tetratricopeptide repeats 2-like isoform X1 n=1 Tax=Salvelinus namaycush TaxID=8040 RepID=A0A8U0R3U7_SALNM|nr:interferon-induced protein with tetratricopeptide repeats 2-like isoform X1 [Salvelinus namaycush]